MEFFDAETLSRWRGEMSDSSFKSFQSLFHEDQKARRQALQDLMKLSDRGGVSSHRDWPSFIAASTLLNELKFNSFDLERFTFLEVYEFLAKAREAAYREIEFLERTNKLRIFPYPAEMLKTLEDLRQRLDRPEIFLPLLQNGDYRVRCLGSFCISCLEAKERLTEQLLKSLDKEETIVATAGLLWWAGKWNVLRARCCEFLESSEPWLQCSAAYSIYQAGFCYNTELTARVLDLLEKVEKNPSLWKLPGWGQPIFPD